MIIIKQFQSISEVQLSFDQSNPFLTNWYLQTYSKQFSENKNLIILSFMNDQSCIGWGVFEKVGDKALFLGMKPVLNGQEVTDYGDILLNSTFQNLHKEIWDQLLKWFSENGIVNVQLDNVREDSMTYTLFHDHAVEQGKALFISLPKTWDEYLLSLDRVDRKELKRKMRRLETVQFSYVCFDTPSENDFEEFVRLHRLSSSQKEAFMSESMKRFFWELITVEKNNWKSTLCFLRIDGKNSSTLLSFENNGAIFGYNSGYDPSSNYYSVGLLLHAYKIKEAIEQGKTMYDFMRGTERYKYDLGGKELKLYKLVIPLQK